MAEEGLSHPVVPHPEPVSQPVVADSRVVELLESENEFLRGQIAVKDRQIEALNERVFETNSLTAGLQKLLSPLLSAPEREQRGPAGD